MIPFMCAQWDSETVLTANPYAFDVMNEKRDHFRGCAGTVRVPLSHLARVGRPGPEICTGPESLAQNTRNLGFH
jgi:hypothetical protein